MFESSKWLIYMGVLNPEQLAWISQISRKQSLGDPNGRTEF